MNYGQRFVTLYRKETGTSPVSKKKKCKEAKWLSEEALQVAVKEERQKAKDKKKNVPI